MARITNGEETNWQALIQGCLVGQEVAWERLVQASYPMMLRYIMGRGASREDAEDLIQNLYKRLLEDGGRRLRAYDPSRAVPFPAYLRVIAGRLYLDLVRSAAYRAGTRSIDVLEISSWLQGPERTEDAVETREILERFDRLTARQRTAVQILIKGLSYQRGAETMGLTEGGFAALVHRARAALRGEE